MRIVLENIGRRFNREWIFRNINTELTASESCAILGNNGAGKSTLLQIIAGSLSPSFGSIKYLKEEREVKVDDIFKHIAVCTPYLELIEEFTLLELVEFHFNFKSLHPKLSSKRDFIQLLGLEKHSNKQVKYFSSGMKQRLKLALACCSTTDIVLLDEPTVNLDSGGINWYNLLVDQFCQNRVLIVCSNQEHEYSFCTKTINIEKFK